MQTLFNFLIRLTAALLAGPSFEAMYDNFCGGGAAGLGCEKGTGFALDGAANHDPHAIAIHSANHPHTEHFTQDIWKIDPLVMTKGRPVGLVWFSPDCKHFSKAKGGKPLSHKIRDLAWVVIKWVKKVSPRVIILENVTEFQTWGPLGKDNMPIKERKGETFKRWVRMLRSYGYTVEWKELVAADYGVPTIRKRLYLMARRDGEPIVWPAPTHAPRHKAFALGLKPWRSAAECIDWDLPCPSIFSRKKELADSTKRRIAIGIMRYVIKSQDPFIVTCNHQGSGFRGQSIKDPFNTITGSRDGHGVVAPIISPYHKQKHKGEVRGQRVDKPLQTVDTQNRHALVTPFLAGVGGPEGSGRPRKAKEPLNSVLTENHQALLIPILAGVGGRAGQSAPRSVKQPMGTTTSKADVALVLPHLVGIDHNQRSSDRAEDPKNPLTTIVTENRHALVNAFVMRHSKGSKSRSPKDPLSTQTTKEHESVGMAFLNKHYTGVVGQSVTKPLGTVTGKDHHSLDVAFVSKFRGTNVGSDAREPVATITAGGMHVAEVRAFLLKYYDTAVGQDIKSPAHTITTKDRLGLVTVKGVDYQIVDIGLRMLKPKELLRAQFGKYADEFILLGNQEQQVKAIGNSVCPEVAEALVRANVKLRKVPTSFSSNFKAAA